MWFMFLCLFVYSKKNAALKPHAGLLTQKIQWRSVSALLALGLPSGLYLVLDMSLFLATALMMGYFGTDALAAYQITSQCIAVAYAIPFSLSMTTALMVSHAVGANDPQQAKRIIAMALIIGLILSGCIAFFWVIFPAVIVRVFLSPGQADFATLQHLIEAFLAIVSFLLCLDAVQTIINGALKGLKDTFMPMLLSIGCYWILGIGGTYYLAFHTPLGADGIWYGVILGIGSTAAILIVRFFYVKKCSSRLSATQ